MNATPATVARTIATRKAQPVRVRPVFTSETGVVRPVYVPVPAVQAVMREFPEHTLSGYSDECACEKWADCYYCGACTPDE